MALFRRRPVVLEAHRFAFVDWDKGGKIEWDGPPPDWIKVALTKPGEKRELGRIWRGTTSQLMVGTLEGFVLADPGDWIIQGVKGELYPCKPDVFGLIYEALA